MIVGVNKYKLDEHDAVDILEVDNDRVREQQVARLKTIRATRDAGEGASGARRADRMRAHRARATCWT